MKRKLFYVAICTIIAGGGVLTSCQKEQPIKPVEQVPQIDHEKLANNIISFRKDVLNTQKQKSGELISLDSAILIMEASFNFHHGVYNKNYTEIMYDSVIIETAYNNVSEISMTFVQSLYTSINNSIYTVFENCTFPNKNIKFVDIYFDSAEGVNYIKTLIAIGNENLQKAGTLPPVTQLPTADDLWLNATPFNDRKDETWEIANGYNSFNLGDGTGMGGGEFSDTEATIAINDEINLEYENDPSYIYYIQTIGLVYYVNSYQESYVYNPDIAGPSEDPKSFFSHIGIWEDGNARWRYSKWNSNTSSWDNYYNPKVDYRYMNKFYNVCMAAIGENQPNRYKKPIDATFVISIYDYFDTGNFGRWLDGGINITYAYSSSYLPQNPHPVDYITPY